MTYFYILFALLGIYVECSAKINTSNIFKKIGLALIVFGSLVEISGHHNQLFEIGAMMYILVDLWKKSRTPCKSL